MKQRADRPHLFFAHERAPCPKCQAEVEGRVVFRGGKGFRVSRCARCGPVEEQVSGDEQAYRAAFAAKARATGPGDHLFKETTSTCPGCLSLVRAQVLVCDGKVYFGKQCPACGASRALVSEDAAYYVAAYGYAKPGTEPFAFAAKVRDGCPQDCGTCPDHEQHTCLPIVEVTDHCNLDCPACIADNRQAHHMAVGDFSAIVDRLVAAEGTCESVALSGGEPTAHPALLELVAAATRPEVGRVVVITNGVRLGRDRALAKALKDLGAYVALQLDGFDPAASMTLRGRDLVADKRAALAMLEEFDLPTQLIFTAARGVNEGELGRVYDLFVSKDFAVSLSIQPMAYTGRGGGAFAVDPLDRLTIPGVMGALEAQTGGRLARSDFFPLPCSHPQCVSLTYLLKLEDGTAVPFPQFTDFKKHTGLLRSSATLPANSDVEDALHDVIHDVFANEDRLPRGKAILKALRRSMDVMFPERALTPKQAFNAGERQAKSILIHAYMDPYDFDLERLRKCCHHYPQVDGRVMPACGFNLFHRGAAKGPHTPRAPFGRPGWAEP